LSRTPSLDDDEKRIASTRKLRFSHDSGCEGQTVGDDHCGLILKRGEDGEVGDYDGELVRLRSDEWVAGNGDMTEEWDQERRLWFGKKEGGLGFGPITREGRLTIALYIFLVVVAVFTYSQLALTGFVVLFYTLVFGSVVIAKSDLMKQIH
jgi:hypothetical protein